MNRVLLVEDDPDVRSTIKGVLELEGYSVEEAANGRDALDFISKSGSPCLILLDLMMPVLNGWQFLELRQKDQRLQSIPVIVLSAAAQKRELTGADAFIPKPFDVDHLIHTMSRFCDSCRRGI